MNQTRLHRATSADGTVIGGPVHGDGPPVVLAHGGLDDGSLSWAAMLPLLTPHFTCYVPSMRGRGHSGDHADLRPERHAEDLAAFVDSIGEPAAVAAYSTGGYYALGAAARGARISRLVLFESPVFEFWQQDNEDAARFGHGVAAMGQAASEGKLAEAAREFLRAVSNGEELAALDEQDAYEQWGRCVPQLLRVLEQAPETEAPDANDPSELAKVTMPVLAVYGSRTTVPHAASARHLADTLAHARLHEVPGVGHMAPWVAPKALADELVPFLQGG